MNVFTKVEQTVEADAHTFLAYFKKEYQKVEANLPQIEKVADTVLKYVGGALQIVLTAEGAGAAASVVGNVVTEAQQDVTVAGSLIYDFGANPTATSMLSSVSENLSGLLTAGHITSTTAVTAANKVVGELNALSTALTAASAPAATAAVAAAPATPAAATAAPAATAAAAPTANVVELTK